MQQLRQLPTHSGLGDDFQQFSDITKRWINEDDLIAAIKDFEMRTIALLKQKFTGSLPPKR